MSLAGVRARIEAACAAAGRSPGDITLVVVSKGRSPSAIQALYEAGQRDFGENRAQELAAKAPELPGDIRWHFVGPLQRNKVSTVRPLVVMLHSLDRRRLAAAWARDGDAPPVLLEVNLAGEPQKHGFAPAEAAAAATDVIELGVDLHGVMAIPPQGEPALPYFEALVELRDALAEVHPTMTVVSAGMTDDFEQAIRAGATTIRVGRAIFE
ncbi:MAG: YggS family pyridoxal phosphate-dependent enzyme [Acidimicrobiia bacterium]|nr:YggS family pyridoxal phosphate-dependent enzyme [Acidimicrobiia bacterium]